MATNNIIRFDKEPRYVFDETHFHLEDIKEVEIKGDKSKPDKKSNLKAIMCNIRYKNGGPRGDCRIRLPEFTSFMGFLKSSVSTSAGVHNIVYNAKKDGTEEEIACYNFFKAFDAWKKKAIVKAIEANMTSSKKVFTGLKREEHAKKIQENPDTYIKLTLDYPRKKDTGYQPELDKSESIWIEGRSTDSELVIKNFSRQTIPFDTLVPDEYDKKKGRGTYIMIIKLNSVFIGEHGSDQIYLASTKPKAVQIYYSNSIEEYDDEDILGGSHKAIAKEPTEEASASNTKPKEEDIVDTQSYKSDDSRSIYGDS